MDNLQLLEEDSGEVSQVMADDEPPLAMQVSGKRVPSISEQIMQMSDGCSLPTPEEDATSALQALQYAGILS